MIVTIPSELNDLIIYHCQHKKKSIAFTSGQN